jgi:hypothetical protein
MGLAIMSSAEVQPGQDRIPNGTKRIIIFDTNAYRELARGSLADCRARAVQLREREQTCSVFVLATPIVIWELTAHLTDPADAAFNSCLKSLAMLGEHAVDPSKPEDGINLFPDADSTVCRELFRLIPAGNEKATRSLAGFVKDIVKHAPDLSDAKVQEHIKQIATHVEATEQQWLKSMEGVLDACDPKAAKQFFGDLKDGELRKQVRDFFASQIFVDMWAKFMVESHARKVGQRIPTGEDLKEKIKVMLAAFPVPFHLMSVLLQKIAMHKDFKLDNPERKRWNFVWDSQLTFSVGPDHKIGGFPIYFVTGDAEFLEAAIAAKCDDRVLSLKDYLASLGLQ